VNCGLGLSAPPPALLLAVGVEGCFSDGVGCGGALGGGDVFAVGAWVVGPVAGGIGAAAPDGVVDVDIVDGPSQAATTRLGDSGEWEAPSAS